MPKAKSVETMRSFRYVFEPEVLLFFCNLILVRFFPRCYSCFQSEFWFLSVVWLHHSLQGMSYTQLNSWIKKRMAFHCYFICKKFFQVNYNFWSISFMILGFLTERIPAASAIHIVVLFCTRWRDILKTMFLRQVYISLNFLTFVTGS